MASDRGVEVILKNEERCFRFVLFKEKLREVNCNYNLLMRETREALVEKYIQVISTIFTHLYKYIHNPQKKKEGRGASKIYKKVKAHTRAH